MSMLGVEEVLAQMQAKLQAELPDKVDELNDEYKDGCDLAVPDAASYRRIFDPADQAELETTSFPAVVLCPEPETAIDGPDLGNDYAIEHTVEVAFIVGYDARERQETRLLRYMRAAKEILGPFESLAAGETRYRGGGFARTWTTSNGIVRDVALIFTVTVYETP